MGQSYNLNLGNRNYCPNLDTGGEQWSPAANSTFCHLSSHPSKKPPPIMDICHLKYTSSKLHHFSICHSNITIGLFWGLNFQLILLSFFLVRRTGWFWNDLLKWNVENYRHRLNKFQVSVLHYGFIFFPPLRQHNRARILNRDILSNVLFTHFCIKDAMNPFAVWQEIYFSPTHLVLSTISMFIILNWHRMSTVGQFYFSPVSLPVYLCV